MMGFYETLSRYYDQLFPASGDEMCLVNTMLAGCDAVVDIGCGTGNKTALIEAPRVVGIDADPGMIAAARQRHAGSGIVFELVEMLDLGHTFAPGSFDAAVCLGNTLPHLPGMAAATNFFKQTAVVLGPGGRLVLQLLNYDRILDNHITSLPEIVTDDVVFRRRYEWRDRAMHFVTCLITPDGCSDASDIVLVPFRKREVEKLLGEAGFAVAARYGNYRGEAYRPDAYHLIIQAELP